VNIGRADFREGAVEAIPFEDGHFGKVCTVNTVYFWKSLDAGFAEIRRVLSPGGRAVVGFLPKEPMERMGLPGDIFTMRTVDEVVVSLKIAAFTNITVERPRPTTPWVVVTAISS
jgi:SAM-dependent methyltransferase